jgi:hypothetical protein
MGCPRRRQVVASGGLGAGADRAQWRHSASRLDRTSVLRRRRLQVRLETFQCGLHLGLLPEVCGFDTDRASGPHLRRALAHVRERRPGGRPDSLQRGRTSKRPRGRRRIRTPTSCPPGLGASQPGRPCVEPCTNRPWRRRRCVPIRSPHGHTASQLRIIRITVRIGYRYARSSRAVRGAPERSFASDNVRLAPRPRAAPNDGSRTET